MTEDDGGDDGTDTTGPIIRRIQQRHWDQDRNVNVNPEREAVSGQAQLAEPDPPTKITPPNIFRNY